MGGTVRSGCRICGSSSPLRIVVQVEGSLLQMSYCPDCERPSWRGPVGEAVSGVAVLSEVRRTHVRAP